MVLLVKVYGVVLKFWGYSKCYWMCILNLKGWFCCVMVGLSFIILSEMFCVDLYVGCCGGWGLEIFGYLIKCYMFIDVLINLNFMVYVVVLR